MKIEKPKLVRITTGDMKRFWDNIDLRRLERISEIKQATHVR